jgi:hypothetical protein
LFYYLESIGFYWKDWQKLLKKNIWWVDFYYPVEKTDLSAWDSSWWKSYKAVLDWYIISLEVQAPLYDEKRNKEVKKEIEKILWGIKINKDNISKSTNIFSTNIPRIEIKDISWALPDTWRYKYYLWNNLYEYVNINLNELIEYNGKWKTVDEIYDVQLKEVDSSDKAKIKFKWLDWYITCSDKVSQYSYYNYYGYYGYYGYTNTDEYGNPIEIKTCQINIYIPLDKELNRQNYISVEIKSETAKIEENLNKVIKFLGDNVFVNSLEKKVTIPNLYSDQIKLKFEDIKKQSTPYKNFLKLLVRYKAIENTTKFEWSKAITWGEYLKLYTKWIYNFDTTNSKCSDVTCEFNNYFVDVNGKKVSLWSIFTDLGIDYDEYISTQMPLNFDKVFKYKLAWIDIWDLNEENMYLFENMPNEKQYIAEQKKINDFTSKIYWVKKILLTDFYSNYSTTFISNKENRYYFTENKLKQIDKFNKKNVILSYKQSDLVNLQKEIEELNKNNSCTKKSSYTAFKNCYNNLKEKIKNVQAKYERVADMVSLNFNYDIVLSKSEALEQIFNQVDFWLFDAELAKKKDTQIEEGSNSVEQ